MTDLCKSCQHGSFNECPACFEDITFDGKVVVDCDKYEKQKKLTRTYGEFNNVKISDDEYSKLKDRLGERETERYIELVSSYLAQTGRRYKSHYATILNWSRRDREEQAKRKPKDKLDCKPTYNLDSAKERLMNNTDI